MELIPAKARRISHKIWGVVIGLTLPNGEKITDPKATYTNANYRGLIGRVVEVTTNKGFKFLSRIDEFVENVVLKNGVCVGYSYKSTRLPKLTSKFRGKFIKINVSYYPGNTHYKGELSRAYKNFRIIKANSGISVEQYLGSAFANGGNPIMDLQRFNKNGWIELKDVPAGREIDTEKKDSGDVDKVNQVEEIEEKDNGFLAPSWFIKFKKLLKIKQHVLLTGPSGCGKTYLTKKAAEQMGLFFGSISCSSGMREDQLLGRMVMKGKMEMAYAETPFITAYENGGVFLFDELDAADENTLITINAALANDGFHCPDRYEKPWISRHPEFVAVAACNTLGLGDSRMYTGRNQIDGATLDRFRAGVIKCDYDDAVEFKLADPDVLAWGRKIRYEIKKHDIDKIMSTRTMIEFSRQARELGFKSADWEDSYFADWSEDEMSECGFTHIYRRMQRESLA